MSSGSTVRAHLSQTDLLDDLSPKEWETPSLCDGWRVRDVAAHRALAQMGWGRPSRR
ncbi:maleylpyruvate isomerase N-terminal domain-containing protein [Blastococcus colisei]|uniref:maleylpyruvate isomerase N-terminal domain-containing protein n=1 Tax=Blastococcus colisei TaxID=1564162 RepID=UPI001B85E7DE|nr:maleylpyruvate isomerase N-terminal domain-containing protein [Blastococcus colisei]